MASEMKKKKTTIWDVAQASPSLADVLEQPEEQDQAEKFAAARSQVVRGTRMLKTIMNFQEIEQQMLAMKEESGEKHFEVVEDCGQQLKVAVLSLDCMKIDNVIRKVCIFLYHSYLRVILDYCFILGFLLLAVSIDFGKRESRPEAFMKISKSQYEIFMRVQSSWFLFTTLTGTRC